MVTKWKWVLHDNDEKIEQWLGELARRGLHLVRVNMLGMYTFEQGAPAEVAYRLDFQGMGKPGADYFQLFEDAGWERAAEMSGWQYWRKAGAQGSEIFSDRQSRIPKYRRLLALLAVCFIPMLLALSNPNFYAGMDQSAPLVYGVVMTVVWVTVLAYMTILIRLALRIHRLR